MSGKGKKGGRNSPPATANEGLVTPGIEAEPSKKKYREFVKFNSRINSEKKVGQVPDKPLTLFPSQGKQASNKKEWLETLEYIISQKYRHCYTAIKNKEYIPWQEPVITKEAEALMSEMQRELAIQKAKSDMVKDEQLKEDLPVIFEMVVATFSLESLKEIQVHYASRTPAIKWETVLENRDVMDLLKAIDASHDVKENGIKILEQIGAQINMFMAKQMRSETLIAFEKRIDKLEEDMVANGLRSFTEEMKAGIMFRGLLPEYTGFKTSLLNECAMNGQDHFPKTMGALTKIAERWVQPTERKHANVFMTVQECLEADVLLTKKKAVEEKKKSGKENKPPNANKKKDVGKLPKKDAKVPEWWKCYHCKENHYAFYCPTATDEERAESEKIYLKKQAAEDGASAKTFMTLSNESPIFSTNFGETAAAKYADICSADNKGCWQKITEDNMHLFPDYTVHMTRKEKEELILTQAMLFPDALILDNGAQVSITREPSFVKHIKECSPITITGSTPGGILVSKSGVHPLFGNIYYDEKIQADIVSFSHQKRIGNHIFYNDNEDFFQVYNTESNRHINFYPFNGLYATNIHEAAKFSSAQVLLGTVEENKLKFSKRQLEMAEKAREFMEGFRVSTRQAQALARSIQGMPINAIDFQRAEFIWGPPKSVDGGKTHTMKSKPLDPERFLRGVDDVAMHCDIMFVDSDPYLISKTTPGGYCQSDSLLSRKSKDLRHKVQRQMKRIKNFSKNVTLIVSDGEGAMTKDKDKLEALEVRMNQEAAGSHIPVIENLIKTVKEHERGRRYTTPLKKAPKALTSLFICCIVFMLNFMPTTVNVNNMSPHEFMTGERPTYNQHFALPMGSYCEVTEPKPATGYNNVDNFRTAPMIALNPTGSIRGAWRFFNLMTGEVVTREKWKVRPMPQSAIDRVASFSGSDVVDNIILESTDDAVFMEPDETQEQFQTVQEAQLAELQTPNISSGVREPPKFYHNNQREEIVSRPTPLNLMSDLEEMDVNPLAKFTVESNRSKGQPRRSLRLKEKTPFQPALFLTRRQAQRKHGCRPIAGAIVDEITQMVIDKKVFTPVSKLSMSKTQVKKALRTNTLLDEKFKSDGSFERHKARLVAMEYKHMSQLDAIDKASPTPQTQNLFMLASIAAKEEREVRKIDVSGAFLNADMSHRQQYVILSKQSARIVVQLMPETEEFLLSSGEMYCLLNKALYGTGEAARLWYNLVVKTLKANGFEQNPYDKCVFNKIIDGKQCTILFHVDDFFISSVSSAALDAIEAMFRNAFEKITVEKGPVISFVGMTFDFTVKGLVHVTQGGYTADLLLSNNIVKKASTPATVDLRKIDENSPTLSEDERQEFHSLVYKLLYLGKRTRPDILVTTQFLSTRVNLSTQQDKLKLDRVLHYINETSYMGILLSANSPIEVIAYIDASYGVTKERRGHTGSMITLGTGSVHAGSKEQSINTKSSCECELVGISDGLSQVIYTRNFLIGQGYEVPPATVMQDNTSTINLAQNGMSNSEKTRHIDIRYFFVTDRINSGDIQIQHMSTENMIADILTKPLQGELFAKLRDLLLGYATL